MDSRWILYPPLSTLDNALQHAQITGIRKERRSKHWLNVHRVDCGTAFGDLQLASAMATHQRVASPATYSDHCN